MAVTATAQSVYPCGFCVNATSADFSGCETIHAAVTGKTHYITSITVSSDGATNFTIGAGKTGAGVTAVLFGPVYSFANWHFTHTFRRPISVGLSTAITVDAGGAANATVIVEGFTE